MSMSGASADLRFGTCVRIVVVESLWRDIFVDALAFVEPHVTGQTPHLPAQVDLHVRVVHATLENRPSLAAQIAPRSCISPAGTASGKVQHRSKFADGARGYQCLGQATDRVATVVLRD